MLPRRTTSARHSPSLGVFHATTRALLSAIVPLETTQGSALSLYRSGSFVTADEAVVTTADVRAANGVVHIVDKVLMPPK